MNAPQQFTNSIRCAGCGQTGVAAWEENRGDARRAGATRKLVLLSAGFHSEAGKTQSGDPLILCNSCGAVLPD
jgi:hypothetical protein